MANLTLFEKLNQIETRYDEMTQQLSSAEVLVRFGALPEARQDACGNGRNGR